MRSPPHRVDPPNHIRTCCCSTHTAFFSGCFLFVVCCRYSTYVVYFNNRGLFLAYKGTVQPPLSSIDSNLKSNERTKDPKNTKSKHPAKVASPSASFNPLVPLHPESSPCHCHGVVSVVVSSKGPGPHRLQEHCNHNVAAKAIEAFIKRGSKGNLPLAALPRVLQALQGRCNQIGQKDCDELCATVLFSALRNNLAGHFLELSGVGGERVPKRRREGGG